jgi:alpha-beta hydrolase superfamily lysophospholipase
VAPQLFESGYVVVAHDAHGQGRSDGFRGYADSIQHYVDNARLAITDAQRHLPARVVGLPNFLLGHSMGGAVAIHLARDDRHAAWAGVLLTSPAVAVYAKRLLKLFAPVLATLAPLMRVQRLKSDRKHAATSHAVAAVAGRVRASKLFWKRGKESTARAADAARTRSAFAARTAPVSAMTC